MTPQTPLEQARYVLSLMYSGDDAPIPNDLAQASAGLTFLMRTAYHPTYMLQAYDHRFEDEGDKCGIYVGDERIGDTTMSDEELFVAYAQASEKLGDQPIDLASAISEPGTKAAAWQLSELRSQSQELLESLIESKEPFVTDWWLSDALGTAAQCGRSEGTLWLAVRGEQDLDSLAPQALDLVIAEAPLDIEHKIQEGAASNDYGEAGVLAELRGLTAEQLNDMIQNADLPTLFEVTTEITNEPQDGETWRSLLGEKVQELDRDVSEAMAENFQRLIALIRGDLYDSEELNMVSA